MGRIVTYPGSPYPHYPPPFGAAPEPRNGLGTAGFVCGLVGLALAWIPIIGIVAWPLVLVGLTLSIIGVNRARQRIATNHGIAVAGIACSALGLLICFTYASLFVSSVSDSSSVPSASSSGSSVDRADRTAVPATREPLPSGTIPGSGLFIVGSDIQPGLYRSTGAERGLFEFCSWSTNEGPSSNSDIIDFGTANADEPIVVEIGPEVGAFETSNCEPWTKIG